MGNVQNNAILSLSGRIEDLYIGNDTCILQSGNVKFEDGKLKVDAIGTMTSSKEIVKVKGFIYGEEQYLNLNVHAQFKYSKGGFVQNVVTQYVQNVNETSPSCVTHLDVMSTSISYTPR